MNLGCGSRGGRWVSRSHQGDRRMSAVMGVATALAVTTVMATVAVRAERELSMIWLSRHVCGYCECERIFGIVQFNVL